MITDSPTAPQNTKKANIQNTLVANAALTRQSEYRMASLADLDGVPIDLANHLLDLHWNRQHHTFLLTYRPEITRGILENGEFGSKFLLNSIFACASKFSTRPEVRESGPRFFRRCEEIMSTENLLLHPSLPTIVGLLLLGSTFVARGVTTKGWLLTGYALRMVYDLGLHIDRKGAENDIIESEVRKRIFWGAFVCDKLQSLYLGRPFAIKLRDAHVSLELNDIMEEHELWTPYDDQKAESAGDTMRFPTYSVSCFQRLCLLSKIMTRIIDEFYVVGATVLSAQSSLRSIDDLLRQWEINLPEGLRLGPERDASPTFRHAPNVLCLHIIHNALIILLHRPLVADGHLRSASPPAVSWKRCSEAAERITLIVSSYRCLYTLRGAPYLISYGLYVACTIHVRNNGATTNEIASENKSILERSVRWLEELAVPNPAVSRTVCIIRKLMEARGVRLEPEAEPIGIISGEETSCITESNRENEFNCDGVVAGMNSWNDPQFLVNEWDESFSDDLLYGFMDQQVPFDDPIPEFDIGSLGQI
ncbi:hypothetical protein N7462_007842 [Penicillium macrosclerotiorum]|uniref:uncharacterized protein n=1 Tax=Penicillium macrosclerotiorum TaxID=303699 RepID=UPI002547CCB2|nr:uncharacterized protein N7462_007842 [Penicillium macrosclerotiorum]KAJ5679598.1 hypothetical protein N7462_007842 [Penicillium macrosclerotiorum]